jgi:hypothetical protein
MAVVPGDADGVALKSIKHPILLHDAAHHDLTKGFGLAQAKPEGMSVPYDQLDCKPGGIMTRSDFGEMLADSLNDAFGEVYADLDPDSFEELWVEIDDED